MPILEPFFISSPLSVGICFGSLTPFSMRALAAMKFRLGAFDKDFSSLKSAAFGFSTTIEILPLIGRSVTMTLARVSVLILKRNVISFFFAASGGSIFLIMNVLRPWILPPVILATAATLIFTINFILIKIKVKQGETVNRSA